MTTSNDFFLRYYVGHKGLYGHEYLDFELDSTGKLKYLNNSKYKSDCLISKEVYVTNSVIEEAKRIIVESGILEKNDSLWPKPDKTGKQEINIRMGDKQVSFKTSKIGSFGEVQEAKDSEGLTVFFYLAQDLKCFIFSLINTHFRIKPI